MDPAMTINTSLHNTFHCPPLGLARWFVESRWRDQSTKPLALGSRLPEPKQTDELVAIAPTMQWSCRYDAPGGSRGAKCRVLGGVSHDVSTLPRGGNLDGRAQKRRAVGYPQGIRQFRLPIKTRRELRSRAFSSQRAARPLRRFIGGKRSSPARRLHCAEKW